MKVSKKKIVTLLIFVSFILIQSITLATSMLNERERKRQSVEAIESVTFLTEEEQETLDLINEYREKNGRSKLKPLANLQSVAKLKAEDIVENEYFSHTSEKLGTPFEMLKANNVSYKKAGENLAGNTTPERAVEAWIESPSHKENILREDFEYTGICVVESPVYR